MLTVITEKIGSSCTMFKSFLLDIEPCEKKYERIQEICIYMNKTSKKKIEAFIIFQKDNSMARSPIILGFQITNITYFHSITYKHHMH